MTVTRTAGLLALVQTILTGSTAAGQNVFVPGDWPTWAGEFPLLFCQAIREQKVQQGRSGLNFEVTTTIRVTGRVAAPAQAADLGASVAEGEAWSLAQQVEVAIINAPALMPLLSQFPFVDTQIKVSAEGREHFAEFVMDIGMLFYQGWEAFCQPPTETLTEVTVTTDLTNVFDPAGTYPDGLFPQAVTPAPRTSGPDGRAEGNGLDIILPQQE